MPPRYQSRPTDLLTRVRNEMDALGRPGMAGTSRLGGNRGRGFGQASVVADGTQENDEANGSAHLLVLSATADSIASGGDYVEFDAIVAQHGFRGFTSPSGGAWVHPVDGVYALTYQDRWAAYTGASVVRLEIDGVLVPEGLLIDGDMEGDAGMGAILYAADAGSVGKIHVDHDAGSSQICSATVRIGITDPKSEDVAASIGGSIVSLGTFTDPDAAGGYTVTGWTDPLAHWVWHVDLDDNGERPDDEQSWIVGSYESPIERDVTVEFAADWEATVYLNGSLLGTTPGYSARSAVEVTLPAGINTFAALAENDTADPPNPAGFIMSVREDSTDAVLFRTTDAGGWTGAGSEPTGWPNP